MLDYIKKRAPRVFGPCPVRELDAKERILLATLIVLPFQCVLQERFAPFSYLDELAVILLAVFILVEGKAGELLRGAIPQVVSIVAFCIIGLLSNFISGIATSAVAISIDAFTCLKFPLTVIMASVIFRNKQNLLEAAIWCGKVLIIIVAVFCPINQFFNIGMGSDYRFGVKSYAFVFTHPTFLSWFLAGILLLFLGRKNEVSGSWIALTLFLICSTMRSKAIGFSVVVSVLLPAINRGKRAAIAAFIVGGAAALALAWGQILYYYTGDGFARADLSVTSLEIAGDYAPLGSGFATFGSNITSNPKYYSQLYYDYGLSEVWGLTPDDASFVSDSFWPTIIAQFGWVGLASYVTMMGLLVAYQYQRASNSVTRILLCAYSYLLISTTGESAFFNPSSVGLAMCLCLAIGGVYQNNKHNNTSISSRETKNSEGVNILVGRSTETTRRA